MYNIIYIGNSEYKIALNTTAGDKILIRNINVGKIDSDDFIF